MRLGSRSALDQLGGSGPYEEAAAILCDRGADRRPVGLHRVGIGDFEFDDEIGGHAGLPWLIYAGVQLTDLARRGQGSGLKPDIADR